MKKIFIAALAVLMVSPFASAAKRQKDSTATISIRVDSVVVGESIKYITVEVADFVPMGKDRARFGKKIYTGVMDAKYYDHDCNEIYNKELRLTNKALFGQPLDSLSYADFAVARPETREPGVDERIVIYSRLSETPDSKRITSLWQLWHKSRRKK